MSQSTAREHGAHAAAGDLAEHPITFAALVTVHQRLTQGILAGGGLLVVLGAGGIGVVERDVAVESGLGQTAGLTGDIRQPTAAATATGAGLVITCLHTEQRTGLPANESGICSFCPQRAQGKTIMETSEPHRGGEVPRMEPRLDTTIMPARGSKTR